MQTPPPSWELTELETINSDQLYPWMEEFLSSELVAIAAEPVEPLLAIEAPPPAPRTGFYSQYSRALVLDHRNRGGRFEMSVQFEDGPTIKVWLDHLLECHRGAAKLYFRNLASTNKRRWNPLVAKHPAVASLAED